MGMLPESLFGWTKPQPIIPLELLQQSEWQDADVLVVGDSFSVGDPQLSNTKPRLWQTVLVQHGFKVRTEWWENVRAICEDFTPWLASKGFKGKYIILENVERAAESNLDKSIKCHNMSYRPAPSPLSSSPEVLPDRQRRDYSGKLSVGFQTWLHELEYSYLLDQSNFKIWELPNHVSMHRLSNGCDLFSHPSCQDVLFLSEDRIDDFDENMFTKMDIIESRLPNLTTIWAIVPDKSTSYLNPNKQFWNQATQRNHAPNLLEGFHQSILNKTVDLYRGNDTHLSTEGFIIMGNLILHSMTKQQLTQAGTVQLNYRN